jgi:spore maturation protein CgeB
VNIIFVDSGASGFHSRYAFDIYSTLKKEYIYTVKQISPKELNYEIINAFKPVILLVVHGSRTPLELVAYARRRGAVTVLWIVEDPYEIDIHRGKMVNSYDFVFTNEKQAVKEYSHPNVFYLPWCCNPGVHKRMTVPGCYESDVCFIGMGFANRIGILNEIAPVLKKYKVKLIGDWRHWGAELHSDLQKFTIPVVDDFREAIKYYNGAKINLNIHRDPENPPSGNSRGICAISPNDRAFALAGCGVFQLVDNTRPDLWEYFNEGTEIVSFTHSEDLTGKIEEYLAKPEQRMAIGQAAQKKAYLHHTFKNRLNQIFRTIWMPGLNFGPPNRAKLVLSPCSRRIYPPVSPG